MFHVGVLEKACRDMGGEEPLTDRQTYGTMWNSQGSGRDGKEPGRMAWTGVCTMQEGSGAQVGHSSRCCRARRPRARRDDPGGLRSPEGDSEGGTGGGRAGEGLSAEMSTKE